MVGLHRHPAARAGVLYNILTRFRKRHSEPHRRLGIERELGRQDGRGALLNRADDGVHILRRADRRHRQEHVALLLHLAPRHLAVDLEEVRRFAKETGADQVAHHVRLRRRREQRLSPPPPPPPPPRPPPTPPPLPPP